MDYTGEEKGQKEKLKGALKACDLPYLGKKVTETVINCFLYLSLELGDVEKDPER